MLDSRQTNLVQVRRNLFVTHISSLSHFVCFPKQQNRGSNLFFPFSGHEAIREEILNLFFGSKSHGLENNIYSPSHRETPTPGGKTNNSQTLLEATDSRLRNRLHFSLSFVSPFILTNKFHHYYTVIKHKVAREISSLKHVYVSH